MREIRGNNSDKHGRGKPAVVVATIITLLSVGFNYMIFDTSMVYDILVEDSYTMDLPSYKRAITVSEVRRQVELAEEASGSYEGDIPGVVLGDIGDAGSGDSGNSGGSSGGSSDINADTVTSKVINHLRSLGYNDISVAAIMGNMYAESGILPATTQAHRHDGQTLSTCWDGNKSGDAHGLVQWDGTRRVALLNFARSRGKDWWDLQVQLDYFDSEINGSECGSGGVMAMNSEIDLEHAVYRFAARFERCGGSTGTRYESRAIVGHWSTRLSSAQSWYAYLSGGN